MLLSCDGLISNKAAKALNLHIVAKKDNDYLKAKVSGNIDKNNAIIESMINNNLATATGIIEKNNTYALEINKLRINNKSNEVWEIKDHAKLIFKDKILTTLSPICLFNKESSLCSEANGDFDTFTINTKMKNYPISFNNKEIELINAATSGDIQLLFKNGKLAENKVNSKLDNIEIIVKDYNLKLKGYGNLTGNKDNIDLFIHGNDNQWEFKGSSNINEPIVISGLFKGKDLVVEYDDNEGIIIDSDISIKMSNNKSIVDGSVLVKSAEMKIKETNQVVKLPFNTTFKKQKIKKETTEGKISLIFGDDVTILSKDYRAKAKGELKLECNDTWTAWGSLHLYDGSYWGQFKDKLYINKGVLTYINSPIDKPLVNVTLKDKIDGLAIFINAYGEINNLNINIYSSPTTYGKDALILYLLSQDKEVLSQKNNLNNSKIQATLINYNINKWLSQIGEKESDKLPVKLEMGSKITDEDQLDSFLHINYVKLITDLSKDFKFTIEASPWNSLDPFSAKIQYEVLKNLAIQSYWRHSSQGIGISYSGVIR